MAKTFIKLASVVVAAATGAAVARTHGTRPGAAPAPSRTPQPDRAPTPAGAGASEAIDAARDRLRARADAMRDDAGSPESGERS